MFLIVFVMPVTGIRAETKARKIGIVPAMVFSMKFAASFVFPFAMAPMEEKIELATSMIWSRRSMNATIML